MPVLILSNHNPQGVIKRLRFDLKTGHFISPKKEIVRRGDLQTKLAFTHPILTESVFPMDQDTYHGTYTYGTELELCLVLRSIYATLVQAEDPTLYSFRVKPTQAYRTDATPYELYFSSHPRKKATQKLQIHEFNAMMSAIYELNFQYCDHNLLDQTLTWADLPQIMQADQLYTAAMKQQSQPHQLSLHQCELRYISSHLGFGVFARTPIAKGTRFAQYCGKYISKDFPYKNYSYLPDKKSGFNLDLNAKEQGNLTRFINHAPNPDMDKSNTPADYLTANLKAFNYEWYGVRRIVLVADRDIAPGEQLLVCYSERYVRGFEPLFNMKKNGKINDYQGRIVQDNYSQLKPYLSVFAQFGNRYAQWLLFRKPICMLFFCCILGLCLR